MILKGYIKKHRYVEEIKRKTHKKTLKRKIKLRLNRINICIVKSSSSIY